MSAKPSRSVGEIDSSKLPVEASSTPLAKTTLSSQVKRALTSPDSPDLDSKKNKPSFSPMSNPGDSLSMEGATGGPIPHLDSDSSYSKVNITFGESEIAQISQALKESFREELRAEMATAIKGIVEGVLSGLNEKIKSLEKDNKSLRKENAGLKTRVQKLEVAAEAAEQYSRRNCLRVSGVKEEGGENTDHIIMKMAGDIGANIDLNDIDRSHRVGKPRDGKPRDIIVKLSTFRVRQRLITTRKELKTRGYPGIFINEDLTKLRSGLLFRARKLVNERRLIGAWSSNGTVLIKDNAEAVHRVSQKEDLTEFENATPRPVDEGDTD